MSSLPDLLSTFTVLPDLDGAQSLSYFLHGVPEWQSGHTTRKQDGSVE